MKVKLKKLHFVQYGEDSGKELPFGEVYDFPDERFIMEFFKQVHEEFPDYENFSFDSENSWTGRCGAYSVQWWLLGELKQQDVPKEYEEIFQKNIEDILA